MTLFDRAQGWLNPGFHAAFRELMLHATARQALLCPVYCLMPDHLHLVWIGLRPATNQLDGMRFLRTHLSRALFPYRLQKQPHDHVLRHSERERNAFQVVCSYVLNNPVRGGLTENVKSWPYLGAIVPGYPSLDPREARFWEIFWRVHANQRDPDCDQRILPPR
jgi:REP element-mobilizing transposase RayT